jgi:hypothetical protein
MFPASAVAVSPPGGHANKLADVSGGPITWYDDVASTIYQWSSGDAAPTVVATSQSVGALSSWSGFAVWTSGMEIRASAASLPGFVTIATLTSQPLAVAADWQSRAVWTTADGKLSTATVGGTVTDVFVAAAGDTLRTGLASNIYGGGVGTISFVLGHAQVVGGDIMQIAGDGSNLQKIATLTSADTQLCDVAGSTTVAWSDAGQLFIYGLLQGQVGPYLAASGQSSVGGVVVDSGWMHWTTNSGGVGSFVQWVTP